MWHIYSTRNFYYFLRKSYFTHHYIFLNFILFIRVCESPNYICNKCANCNLNLQYQPGAIEKNYIWGFARINNKERKNCKILSVIINLYNICILEIFTMFWCFCTMYFVVSIVLKCINYDYMALLIIYNIKV